MQTAITASKPNTLVQTKNTTTPNTNTPYISGLTGSMGYTGSSQGKATVQPYTTGVGTYISNSQGISNDVQTPDVIAQSSHSNFNWKKALVGTAQVIGGIGELIVAGGMTGTGVGTVGAVFVGAHGISNIMEGVGKVVNSFSDQNIVPEVNPMRTGYEMAAIGVAKVAGADENKARVIGDTAYYIVDTGISAYGTVSGIRSTANAVNSASNTVQIVNKGYGFTQVSSRLQQPVPINPSSISWNPNIGSYVANPSVSSIMGSPGQILTSAGLASDPINYYGNIKSISGN